MLAILVASSKGGSGKSTLATQLAGYFALAGKHTALIDADPQASSSRWCDKRAPTAGAVKLIDGHRRGWEKQVPAGAQRVLIDTPAGSTARDLEVYVDFASAVLVPVCPSPIDLEATLPFLASLAALDKIRRGRRPLAVVGNRMRPWTASSRNALAQIETWPHPVAGSLRDTQAYVLLAGLGKCLFDYQSEQVREHQQDWMPVLQWLRQVNKAR